MSSKLLSPAPIVTVISPMTKSSVPIIVVNEASPEPAQVASPSLDKLFADFYVAAGIEINVHPPTPPIEDVEYDPIHLRMEELDTPPTPLLGSPGSPIRLPERGLFGLGIRMESAPINAAPAAFARTGPPIGLGIRMLSVPA